MLIIAILAISQDGQNKHCLEQITCLFIFKTKSTRTLDKILGSVCIYKKRSHPIFSSTDWWPHSVNESFTYACMCEAGPGSTRLVKLDAAERRKGKQARRRRRTGGGPAGRQAGRRQILKQLWSPPNLPFSLCCNKCSMQQPISLFRYFQALVSPICSSQQPIPFIGYFQAVVSPICSSQQPIPFIGYFQALVSPICSLQQPIPFIGCFQAVVSPICSLQQPIPFIGYFQALVSPICNSHVLLLANHSLLFLVSTLSVSCRNPETSLTLSVSPLFCLL